MSTATSAQEAPLETRRPQTWIAPRASEVRARLHPPGSEGSIVTYLVDCNLHPTNVCITDCGFCAFYRSPGDVESYVLSCEETGGFQCDIPMSFHPDKAEWSHLPASTTLDELREIAVAQVVLSFGARSSRR